MNKPTHLEIEVAANMAYEWITKYHEYCIQVNNLHAMEQLLGRSIDAEQLWTVRDELLESSNAVMEFSTTLDFETMVDESCLHKTIFYLGISYITNAQCMQEISELLRTEDNPAKRNYLYVLNEEQLLIHNNVVRMQAYMEENTREIEAEVADKENATEDTES